MKKLILNNVSLKITALLLAMGLWLYIYSNYTPRFSATYPAEIHYINKSKSLDLVNAPRSITITLKGLPENFRSIDPKQIWADADLSKATPGVNRVPLLIHENTGARVVDRHKLFVRVELKMLNSIERPLEVIPIGSLSIEKSLGQITPKRRIVKLFGNEKDLDRVEKATVALYLSDQKRTFTMSLPVEARDAMGDVVRGVRADPGKVRVTVEVNNANMRLVPVELNYWGQIEENGEKIALEFSPTSVTVFGKEEFLSRVSGIQTQHFTLNTCEPGESFDVDLSFPRNVFSFEDKVTITCSRPEIVSRDFTVNIGLVKTPRNMKAVPARDTIEVTIRGESTVLNVLKLDQISAELDLSGCDTPGVCGAPVNVTLINTRPGLEVSFKDKKIDVHIEPK